MESEKCWLCLRITPKDLAQIIYSLPFSENIKHNILEDSTTLVKKAYIKNPTFFCGKSKHRIIGGLMYIMGLKYQRVHPLLTKKSDIQTLITQREIAEYFEFQCTEQTIREGLRDWVKLFPGLVDFVDNKQTIETLV